GDGQDVINDIGGSDKIVFGEGISQGHVHIRREGTRHIVISLLDDGGQPTGDQITIEEAFNDSRYRVETLEFADGSVMDWNAMINSMSVTPAAVVSTETSYAVLVDALNAFDADSEAEFDGFVPARMSTEQYNVY
ncbi:calcium-binding protein, partial [Rheinheimera pacifica]|uniref:calcium-binding protein n=1 Tax=Rheinheimera pacifica TaxID=173990 RepID=UPI002EDA9071